MNEDNKIYAKIEWYDNKKGYGIANKDDISLFVHSSYFPNNKKDTDINIDDIISCSPTVKNGIYHALNAEVVVMDNKYSPNEMKNFKK